MRKPNFYCISLLVSNGNSNSQNDSKNNHQSNSHNILATSCSPLARAQDMLRFPHAVPSRDPLGLGVVATGQALAGDRQLRRHEHVCIHIWGFPKIGVPFPGVLGPPLRGFYSVWDILRAPPTFGNTFIGMHT